MATNSNVDEKPMKELLRDVTSSSRDAFQAGERVAADLDAIERRIDRATDWRTNIAENPLWWIAGALVGGLLLWRIFR